MNVAFDTDLLKEVNNLAEQLVETNLGELTVYQAYDIAVRIQQNSLYASANVVNTGLVHPSALEKIGMELEKLAEK